MNAHESPVAPRPSRWWTCLFVLLPALAIAGFAWLLHQARPPVATTNQTPMEALRAELELKNDRLHRIGSTNLFTGLMLERFADGSLRSRSAVTNGLLDGLSEGRYTNGQTQVTEYFREGISHGLRTKWYMDGTRLSEAMVVEGKLHGTFRRWHTNGALAEAVELKEGQPDGPATAYFPSGFLKSRAVMRNGTVVEQKLWKDGEYQEPPAQQPVMAAAGQVR